MSNVWAVAFDRHPSLPSDVPRQLANIDREKERIIKLVNNIMIGVSYS